MQDPVDLRTIFWKTAPITVRRSERDESFAELNLVRIYISNDAESCFLYSLDILEQHYGRVREEEQLLVDFAGFAEKVAWLLNQCCGDSGENDSHIAVDKSHTKETTPLQPPQHLSASPPPSGPAVGKEGHCKFRAILNVFGSGAGLLRLVESNTFKDLAHLSLQLRAGSDSSIKQFLAFRLGEVKADCSRLSASLYEMHAAKNNLEAELKSCQRAAADMSQDNQTKLHQANAEISGFKTQLKAAQASTSMLKEELASVHEQLATARDRASIAEAQVSNLQHTKSELEVELSERLSQLQEATTRAAVAEASAAQVVQRCQGFEAALQQAEIRVDEWKGIASGHQHSAAAGAEEAAALRERCATAAQENLALHKQLQEKSEMATEAENKASELLENLKMSEKKAAELKEKLESVQISAGGVQAAAAKAATELEEARDKIESNDKMIAWLNKQLTAAQLQASTVAKPRIQVVPFNGSNISTAHNIPALKPFNSATASLPGLPAAIPGGPTPGLKLKHNNNSNHQHFATMTTPPIGNSSAAPMPLTPEHSSSHADWPKPRPPLPRGSQLVEQPASK
ncbi:hypothetical protein Ndes2526B_g05079 [Nannochloris sp. 'desiccata']|nr:hypothetical protein KSW81_000014 [Chlorella desiccata (nom. nud.)]KAH7619831.1 hypothetical protein NADE_008111 [Chlorella desiccata (nom. nud.)]